MTKNIDIKEYAKETFDNINLSNKSESYILENILTKKRGKSIYFKILLTSLIIFFSTFCIVYAGNIINSIKSQKIEKTDKNGKYYITKFTNEGTLNINENIDISKYKSKEEFYIKDIENDLNIKFLKNDFLNNNTKINPNITYDDDKISYFSFSIKDMINNSFNDENFNIYNYYVGFKTQYYNNSEDLLTSSAPRWARVEEYYLDYLKVNSYIVLYNQNENSKLKQWSLRFVYNNIFYMIDFTTHVDNPYEEIDKFINELET